MSSAPSRYGQDFEGSRRRVLRVMGRFNFGGTESRTAELIPRLARAGVDVDIITLSSEIGPGPLADVVSKHGGSIFPIQLDFRFPSQLLKVIRQVRPNVLHVDCGNFSGLVLAIGAVGGVETRVAHFRGDDNHLRGLASRARRWVFKKLLAWYATDILGVSDGSLTYGYDPSWRTDPRCKVILNGLDVDRLLSAGSASLRKMAKADPDHLLCVSVGRGSPEKRRWMIPSIIAEMERSGTVAHAFIIGPTNTVDDKRLARAASQQGVEHRIHNLGARSDVGWLLRQANVVIHPSCLEGLPGGVLEPVALGVGTVAADLPGVRYISDRLPGVKIVPVNADAKVWATAALSACKHTRRTNHTDALETFSNSEFSIDRALSDHLKIYMR